MVPSVAGDVSRRPASASSDARSSNRPEGPSSPPPAERRAVTNRVEIVRNSFRNQGFSELVSDLLVDGNRPATIAAYNSSWNCWADWCFRRSADPLCPSLAVVLDYLAELFKSGKSYSSVNSHRSMLSKTLPPFDGHLVGCHPLVKRLLRACYNLNPPQAKYSATWDTDVILSFISGLEDNQSLSLALLTQKTVILLALATLFRVSELASIDASSLSFTSFGVTLSLRKPRKAQHSGPLQSVSIPSFSDPMRCPVAALQSYVERTKSHRVGAGANALFFSLKSPFTAVTPSTISRWIRTIMLSAGVDTSVFGAHSTRGAAASRASVAGAHVDSILRSGHWARASTFFRFYKRSVDTSVASAIFGEHDHPL